MHLLSLVGAWTDYLCKVKATGVLPAGLFVEQAIQEMKKELVNECDYAEEAVKQQRFKTLLRSDHSYFVPAVHEASHLTTATLSTC